MIEEFAFHLSHLKLLDSFEREKRRDTLKMEI